jgi:hypothetical protein
MALCVDSWFIRFLEGKHSVDLFFVEQKACQAAGELKNVENTLKC